MNEEEFYKSLEGAPNKVIKFRGNSPEPSISMNRIETAILIGSLFKRSDMAPVHGCKLTVWFKTDTEAQEMQKLLYKLVPPKIQKKHEKSLADLNAVFETK